MCLGKDNLTRIVPPLLRNNPLSCNCSPCTLKVTDSHDNDDSGYCWSPPCWTMPSPWATLIIPAFTLPAPSAPQAVQTLPRVSWGRALPLGTPAGIQVSFQPGRQPWETSADPQPLHKENRELRHTAMLLSITRWWILIRVDGRPQILFPGYLLLGCRLPIFFLTDKNVSASLPRCC